MRTEDFVWDVNYWTQRFEEETKRLESISNKLCQAPIPALTYEERFMLRDALINYSSYTHLLRESLNRYESTPKLPFYKRIFLKK